MVQSDIDSVYLVAGTRCGHLLTMRISNRNPEDIRWTTEALGLAPVDVFTASVSFGGDASALICCDSYPMVLTGFSKSRLCFKKKTILWLTDSNDPSLATPPVHSIFALERSLSNDTGHVSLMLLAGSKLLFAEVWPQFALVPRSMTLEGSPTRVIFSKAWKCLVVSLLRDNKPTLAFIDRETGQDISTASDKDRNESTFISGLGHSGDRIFGLAEWLYIKDGKTFAFLLVTTKSGKLLIVSVEKMETQLQNGKSMRLVYWTRYKKAVTDPIYSVVGDDDGIIYCADKTLYRDVLDTAEKKLRNVKQHVLDSPATSIRVSEGKIYALTTMHSLEVLDYVTSNDKDMSLIHTDRVSRSAIHMMGIGHAQRRDNTNWPITLLSEARGGLAGVSVPTDQRYKEFATIFEATLSTSVRRFTKARTRPLWLESQRLIRYGVIPSDPNGSEAFAVSLDGSLRHFTLIDLDLWRLLSLIQTLAQKCTALRPVDAGRQQPSDAMDEDDGYDEEEGDIEPRMHPKQMHIDGDILEMCLDRGLLEKVIGRGDGLDLFCEYLDGIEGGKCTEDFRDGVGGTEEERMSAYFEVGYAILEYLLDPVL